MGSRNPLQLVSLANCGLEEFLELGPIRSMSDLMPKIMGAQTGLHPAVVIIVVFSWGTAFDGILGMIVAIPLTAFFVTAWRLAALRIHPRASID
jgi:hypothetical protein